MIEIKDKPSSRKSPAPLTHELLARKGQAASAAWGTESDTVRQLAESVENAAATPSAGGEHPDRNEDPSRSSAATKKVWAIAAVVLLVMGSAAVGYFAQPDQAAESTSKAEQRAAIPVPAPPNANDVALQESQPFKEQAVPEAIAPSSGGTKQADLAIAAGAESKTVPPLPPPAPQAGPTPKVEADAAAIPTPPTKPKEIADRPAAPAGERTAQVTMSAVADKDDTPDIPTPPASGAPEKPITPAQSESVPEPPKPAALAAKLAAKALPKAEKPVVQTASRPKPPKRGVPPVAPNSVYAVQLASVKSQRAANLEWARLKKRFAKIFGPLKPSIQKTSIAKRGTFYRIRATGFETKKQARDLCAKMKAAGQGCLVVRR